MSKKRIFITGISGQDGSYLAEYMLSLGHEVHGLIRRNSMVENQTRRIYHIKDDLYLYYGDMTDKGSLEKAIIKAQPDYVFHLAAQSHVRVSFDAPESTLDINGNGTLRLLEACKSICPQAHIYNAASSEMFGLSVDADNFQRESTSLNPTSPYGISKVMGYNLARHYRRAYNMFITNGICFNHESPRRGANFVSQKVVLGASRIKKGENNTLELGNLDSFRDWGHAKDYVKAMWLMANHIEPLDFVVATGRAYSVRDMCKVVFEYFGLNYENYIVQNIKYMRDEEVPYLKGDSTKIRTILGWEPEYTFKTLLYDMIKPSQYNIKFIKEQKIDQIKYNTCYPKFD